MSSSRANVFAAVFLTSLCVLTLELALTRLFSATMYYHFAFLAISVALFGSGASGVFVFLAGDRLKRVATETLLAVFAALFALSVVLALAAVLTNPLAESGEADASFWKLTRIYIATAIPFFFAGCAITVAISRFATDVGRLYLFDLAGAAAGCLLLVPLLNRLGAVNAVLAIAMLAAIASVVAARRIFGVIIAVILAALLAFNFATNQFDVHWAKGNEPRDLLFSKWNSFSHVTVQGKPRKDRILRIAIDSDADTFIFKDGGRFGRLEHGPIMIEGLAHLVRRNGNVLIIGPGGGRDVVVARLFGQKRITAVEVNRIITDDIMRSEPFRSWSGDLYGQPDVRLVADEGRSFIRSSDEQYDLIQATMVDTWAATAAGAFALAENNLYTVEAFQDYIRHLTPDGMLSFTRWYLDPPDQILRLITITRAAMDELGIEGADQRIAVFRHGDPNVATSKVATFLFKKSPFTDAEVRTLEAAARQRGIEVIYTPRTRRDSAITRVITAPDPIAAWTDPRSDITPTRDDNPFFFNTVRLSYLGNLGAGSAEWKKTNLGTYVLFSLLVISAAMVLLFIVGPLAVARGRAVLRTRDGLAWLLYFGALGLGFIVIEVAMIQKFILFLGHPVYALVVVLFAILCFCALGSYLTRRFSDEHLPRTLRFVILAIVALVAIYIVALPPIFYGLVHLPQPARIAIAVVLLIPLALVMGMPMPIGIRLAARESAELIPWAWGINGATSVLGSVAALALAILIGFSRVLGAGAAVYLAALLMVGRFGVRAND